MPNSPALPKPDRSGRLPTEDEFAAWCEHPCTRFIAFAHEIMADRQKAAWLEASWEHDRPDPLVLAASKARADAHRSFLESQYLDYRAVIERKLTEK